MTYYTYQEQQDLTAFGRSYKDYVDAYNKTLNDLEIHGTLLREFIWKRDTTTKLKLQMIDAVVKGDIERVKKHENELNSFLPRFEYSGKFNSASGPTPDWTFNPSLLEVYTPTPITTELTSASTQDMAIIESKVEISQAQSLPEDQRSAIIQAAEDKIASAIADGGTISVDEELTPEMIDAYNTYKENQPTLSASIPVLGWFIIGGIAVSLIASSLFHKKAKG